MDEDTTHLFSMRRKVGCEGAWEGLYRQPGLPKGNARKERPVEPFFTGGEVSAQSRRPYGR